MRGQSPQCYFGIWFFKLALGGFLWAENLAQLICCLSLGLSKAFSPSTKRETLGMSGNVVGKHLFRLRKKYKAKNTRHLMYLRYERNARPEKSLKATPKELEILAQFVVGKTYKRIGAELGIGVKTIKTHIDNLLAKNGCQDADELVILYADWEYQNENAQANP